MGKLKFEVPHSLGREEAKKRVEALIGYWSRKYGVNAQWAGDNASFAGKAMGFTIDATLQILDGKVAAESTDPGLLLRGQATKYLQKTFARFLDPAKTLADLNKESSS